MATVSPAVHGEPGEGGLSGPPPIIHRDPDDPDNPDHPDLQNRSEQPDAPEHPDDPDRPRRFGCLIQPLDLGWGRVVSHSPSRWPSLLVH